MGILGMVKNIGEQTAGGIISQGIGMALQPLKNKMQLRQQGKLQELQIKGDKELAEYQRQQQMQMWNDTNIEAQKEHYKKAGMNPGLMYGMGGGGGTTTGGGTATTVSGATAETSQGMGMQMLTAAQTKLMVAQANNLDADTAKKTGVDTKKTESEIENLIATTANTKAKTTLTNLQSDFQKLENTIKDKTLDKAIARIEWEADDAFERLQKDSRENNWGEETYQTSIKILEQQYQNLIIEEALKKSEINKNKVTTTAIDEENRLNIKRTYEQLAQKWQELSGTQKDLKELKNTNEYNMLEGILGTVGATALLQLLTKKPHMIKGYGFKQ